ncbi:hypothetical protein [Streptomyces halstedii]|uniref:hypothetical protein n=1 Tax=Streptomyces halstedii TaxID=1944 RepID=UPI0036C3CD4D
MDVLHGSGDGDSEDTGEVDDVTAVGAADQKLPSGAQHFGQDKVAQVSAAGCVEGD